MAISNTYSYGFLIFFNNQSLVATRPSAAALVYIVDRLLAVVPILTETRQPTSGWDLCRDHVIFGPDEHVALTLQGFNNLMTTTHGWQGNTPYGIIKGYEERGIHFDRMLMWEAEQVSGKVIFKHVPSRWYHAWQFFDLPVTTNTRATEHPLNVIRKVAGPDSFISFKIDIDTPEVEIQTVQALVSRHLRYPNIRAGQMELFFEYHVGSELMRKHWFPKGGVPKVTETDAYRLFLVMRMLGIRAHSWI